MGPYPISMQYGLGVQYFVHFIKYTNSRDRGLLEKITKKYNTETPLLVCPNASITY